MRWTPPLRLEPTGDGCRLSLVGVSYGNGGTLQEAADDLIARLVTLATSIRHSGFRGASELGPPDPRLLDFVWELGELAARGEDIRPRVFGAGPE
jgi:hypothetical protein